MSFADLLKISQESDLSFKDVVLTNEMMETGMETNLIEERMKKLLQVMLEEAERNYGKTQNTLTGLTGKNANKLYNYKPKMMGEFNHVAMIAALSSSENNAAMGRIVACPTAGACGVMPGVLYALKKVKNVSINEMLPAFIVAGGIGSIIAKTATIAGAAGGCQAEIGTATAMAAAALTYYYSKNGEKSGDAAALSLKSLMGLVCDPLGGFVEVPCVKRNATALNIAIATSEMALSGIKSVIPLDEVIEAMYKVGKALPESLRETGNGGIAITPTAIRLIKNIKNMNS